VRDSSGLAQTACLYKYDLRTHSRTVLQECHMADNAFPIQLGRNPVHKELAITIEGRYKEYLKLLDLTTKESRLVLSGWQLPDFIDPTTWKYKISVCPKSSEYTYSDVQWTSDGKYIVFRSQNAGLYIMDPFSTENGKPKPQFYMIDKEAGYINIDRMTVLGRPHPYGIISEIERGNKEYQIKADVRQLLEQNRFECYPDPSIYRNDRPAPTEEEIENTKKRMIE
jgi:hypothetical protein